MEAAENGRLLLEQRVYGFVVGKLRQDGLYRDRLAGLDVVPAVNLAHPARCNAFVDFIGVVQLNAGIEGIAVQDYACFSVRGHDIQTL
jgi:hypothetical protein